MKASFKAYSILLTSIYLTPIKNPRLHELNATVHMSICDISFRTSKRFATTRNETPNGRYCLNVNRRRRKGKEHESIHIHIRVSIKCDLLNDWPIISANKYTEYYIYSFSHGIQKENN